MKKSIGYGRGSVYTIILKALQSGDKYGYEICKEIEEKSNGAYILKQPSLYSGLKRLEAQKDVYSYWGDSDIGGRRHYYSLTEKGKERINRTNFSWEDARADVLGDLFELTEDEKAVNSLKKDVQNVSADIDSISSINTQMQQQIEKNQDALSEKDDELIKVDSQIQNKQTPDESVKIDRHSVNQNQQDLFSLFATPFVSDENNQSTTYQNENSNTDAITAKNTLNNIESTTIDDTVKNSTLGAETTVNNIDDTTTKIADNTSENAGITNADISNNNAEIASKNTKNIDDNIDTPINNAETVLTKNDSPIQNQAMVDTTAENKNIIDTESDKTKGSVNKANNSNYCKVEKSFINVQDYINSKQTSTLFDEEIKRPEKVISQSQPNTQNNSTLSDSNLDDEQEKQYQEFLKSFDDQPKQSNVEKQDEELSSYAKDFNNINFGNIDKNENNSTENTNESGYNNINNTYQNEANNVFKNNINSITQNNLNNTTNTENVLDNDSSSINKTTNYVDNVDKQSQVTVYNINGDTKTASVTSEELSKDVVFNEDFEVVNQQSQPTYANLLDNNQQSYTSLIGESKQNTTEQSSNVLQNSTQQNINTNIVENNENSNESYHQNIEYNAPLSKQATEFNSINFITKPPASMQNNENEESLVSSVNTSNFSSPIQQNASEENVSTRSSFITNTQPYPVKVKEIFGDLIEDVPTVNEQEIQQMKDSILAENRTKNEFATNDTKQLFEEYNKINFKANDDLPRADISNNVNLTLDSSSYEKPQKVYKAPFKSYHDDEQDKDDFYDKIYERAMQEKMQKSPENTADYDDNYNATSNANSYDYQSNYGYNDANYGSVPFDKKYAMTHPQSSLETENFTVRRYRNNYNIKNVESKYFNLSKFRNINNLITTIILMFSTLLISLLAVNFAKITQLQQTLLIIELCLTAVFIAVGICEGLLHKDQRKLKSKKSISLVKACVLTVLLIIVIALNLTVLKIDGYGLNYYASLLIPVISLVLLIIKNIIMIKVEKSSFLYK